MFMAFDAQRLQVGPSYHVNLVASRGDNRRHYFRRVEGKLKAPWLALSRSVETLSPQEQRRPNFDADGILNVLRKAHVMDNHIIGQYRECLRRDTGSGMGDTGPSLWRWIGSIRTKSSTAQVPYCKRCHGENWWTGISVYCCLFGARVTMEGRHQMAMRARPPGVSFLRTPRLCFPAGFGRPSARTSHGSAAADPHLSSQTGMDRQCATAWDKQCEVQLAVPALLAPNGGTRAVKTSTASAGILRRSCTRRTPLSHRR